MSINLKNAHPKITNFVKNMLIDLNYNLPYYGEFCLRINFFETKSVPTCGVNVSTQGMNFYQNFDFLSSLSDKEINFIVIHEIYHLLFNHPQRTVGGRFDHKLSNVVQDMIINQVIVDEFPKTFIDIPKDKDGKNTALFVPKEYEGQLIFEELYYWVKNKHDEHKQKQQQQGGGQGQKGQQQKGQGQPQDGEGGEQGEGQGQGQPSDQQGKGNGKPNKDDGYGKHGRGDQDTWSLDHIFDNLEENNGSYLDCHMDDEVPAEMRDHIVKDVMHQLKSRGLEKGGIEGVIGKLRKRKKDHLKEIKRAVSNSIFGNKKVKTIIKPNRRDIEGIKGNRKIRTMINCILDTSGSMGGLHEKVLSYIFQNDITVNLIQCDTEVNQVNVIKSKKELQNLNLKGFGGTVLQPAVDYVTANLNEYSTVILTDGYTDTLNFSHHKGRVLVVTTDQNIGHTGGKWVKQIIVDKEHHTDI
jgi:predicted metal-dependent peptidase